MENLRIENVLTENDVCELFGMNKDGISRLRREKKLPFVKVTDRSRVYLEPDIMGWLETHRIVIDKNE